MIVRSFALSILRLLELVIFIEVILSWVTMGRGNELTMMIHKITNPILEPARKIQQKIKPGLMMDFSPIIGLLIIAVVRWIVSNFIWF